MVGVGGGVVGVVGVGDRARGRVRGALYPQHHRRAPTRAAHALRRSERRREIHARRRPRRRRRRGLRAARECTMSQIRTRPPALLEHELGIVFALASLGPVRAHFGVRGPVLAHALGNGRVAAFASSQTHELGVVAHFVARAVRRVAGIVRRIVDRRAYAYWHIAVSAGSVSARRCK